MKFGVIFSALAVVVMLGGGYIATPASAQTKAECRQHLAGTKKSSNPQAEQAARQRYQDCLKKAKK